MTEEIVLKTPEKPLPFYLRPGLRKFTALVPALGLALVVGSIALFTGHMSEGVFESYTIGLLMWGGGIFAAGNVLEHVSKAFARK